MPDCCFFSYFSKELFCDDVDELVWNYDNFYDALSLKEFLCSLGFKGCLLQCVFVSADCRLELVAEFSVYHNDDGF